MSRKLQGGSTNESLQRTAGLRFNPSVARWTAAANPRRWTRQEIKLLGTHRDREIARRLQRPVAEVHIKRLRLHIKAWQALANKSTPPRGPETIELLFGPYAPPRTRPGKWLSCERHGLVQVYDFSDAPIPWPIRRTASRILCGDLVRAVRFESRPAVAYHWGVAQGTVTRWRRVLEVSPITAGTRRLKSFLQTEAFTPALRAHVSRIHSARRIKITPRLRARFAAGGRLPKPARWFTSMAPHFAARRGKPVNPKTRCWTHDEDKLLGTKPDRELAKILNRTYNAVLTRRLSKKIPYTARVTCPWTSAQLKLVGKLPDREVVSRTGHPLSQVQAKRLLLGYRRRPRRRLWTAAEDRLLTKYPNAEIARRLNRSILAVHQRRHTLKYRNHGTTRTRRRGQTVENHALIH